MSRGRMMTRRAFLGALPATALAAPAAAHMAASTRQPAVAPPARPIRGTFALDGDRARFFSPAIREHVRITVIADTHLFLDDERGAPFRAFSTRMARAYNQTTHVRAGGPTNPEACFDEALKEAREQRVDLLVLAGDIFSFPSEAAVEWALQRLQASGVPFVYTAGNHDWHYEGMTGTIEDLRREWTARRLGPLYQGQDPLMAARAVKGVRVVTIDNSTYGIQPAQLDFFRAQAASGMPLLLVMHVPLYAPGRPVGFGCGHPEWGAATDKNADLERRPRWPETGHTAVTMAFHREVFSTPALLGVVAGHLHKPSLDVVDGIPQLVVVANAEGGQLHVECDAARRPAAHEPPAARL
jgi:predicted phosphodiesterase